MKNRSNPQEVHITDVFYVGVSSFALSLKVINVTSKLRILFRVMFTKHSPEFYLICADLASNALYYCRLSQGILGLFQLIAHQAFRRLA